MSVNIAGAIAISLLAALSTAGCGKHEDLNKVPPVSATPQVPAMAPPHSPNILGYGVKPKPGGI